MSFPIRAAARSPDPAPWPGARADSWRQERPPPVKSKSPRRSRHRSDPTPKSIVPIRRVRAQAPDQAGPNAIDGQARALSQNQVPHVLGLRAQRHANADLVGALADVVGDHAVDSHRGQQERDRREGAQQRGVEARVRPRPDPPLPPSGARPPRAGRGRAGGPRGSRPRPAPAAVPRCAPPASWPAWASGRRDYRSWANPRRPMRSGLTSPTTPTISATASGDLIDRDAPADGAACGPEAPRQRLVHHDHRRRIASCRHRPGRALRADGIPMAREVRRRDRTRRAPVGAAPASGAGRPSTAKVAPRTQAGQRQGVDGAHRAHAGQRGDAVGHLVEERDPPVRRGIPPAAQAARGRSARPPAESRGPRCAAG